MTKIIAVDQGTTATKAAVIDEQGRVVAHVKLPVSRSYPRPGWVEQNPNSLWHSVRNAIMQLQHVDAQVIALTNQRESVLFWDRKTGEPLTPCVSWQCTRGTDICRALVENGGATMVRELTGLPVDPMFSASKLRWLLDADASLRSSAESGRACAGTIDSWIISKLTGGELHVSDVGNASRTLLLDVHRAEWSEELLGLFGIPAACLPRLVASGGPIGEVRAAGLQRTIIGASLADSHAAAYGLGCTSRGRAKATYGTGTSVLAPVGPELVGSDHGLAATIAWSLDSQTTYALEGNVFSSGATVEWVSGVLGLSGPGEVEHLAAGAQDAAGVHIVPAFSGLGAPYWATDARGLISGLTFASGRAQIARAALDSIALQVTDLAQALGSDLQQPITELRVDGGASRNDGLMQRQADLLGVPVIRLDDTDASIRGVALAAAGSLRVSTDSLRLSEPAWTRFDPKISDDLRAEQLAGWHSAVARALSQREQAMA
jgi:glycerol kinase